MNETAAVPITSEDLFRLKSLNGAALSPDGGAVVYAVSHIENHQAPDELEAANLWVLSLAEGSQPRPITTGPSKDTAPRWSPDGRQIAFLSTRGGKPQFYVVPAEGGEPWALTSLPEGAAGAPAWSPDGSLIAFRAGPQALPDPKLPYGLTRGVFRFDGLGYLDRVVTDLYVAPANGGEARRLTRDGWNNRLPMWSPDGRQILYLADMKPDSLWADMADVRVVDLEGRTRDLTTDWGYIVSAAWSPDGQRVLFIGTPRGRAGDTRYDLYTLEPGDGRPEPRTAGQPGGAGTGLGSDLPALRDYGTEPVIAPGADGSAAFVQVQIRGAVHILRAALTGPESAEVVVGGERGCVLLGASAERLLFGAGTMLSPHDLYVAAHDGRRGQRRLTYLNDDFLETRERPHAEHLLFSAPDGQEIEGWMLLPGRGEPPFPTVLNIHGGPTRAHGQAFLFDFHMLAAAGYVVLFINYRGSSGYGTDFADKIMGDLGRLEFADLMAGVDAAVARGLVDPDRLAVTGGSYGGYLTCWAVGHTHRFKAAIAERPLTNLVSAYGAGDIPGWWADALGGAPHEIPEVYARCSPLTYAHRCRTPTLLMVAEEDHRCPPEESEQFYTALKQAGCTVEMLRLPLSSHAGASTGPLAVRRAQNEALLGWVKRYVP